MSMEEVSSRYDDWYSGGFPHPDTVKEVLNQISAFSELVIDDVYVRDSDGDWKIVPSSITKYGASPSIPAPNLEQLICNINSFGDLQIISKSSDCETEAWCNGFEGLGLTAADALLRLYVKLFLDKRKREDRAAQPETPEEDPSEKMKQEFLSYGWEPCAPDGTDMFCAEKCIGDAYTEARHIVIVEDHDGMWYAEVYKTTPDSPCIKTTLKYRSHIELLRRLNDMMQDDTLDDTNDR